MKSFNIGDIVVLSNRYNIGDYGIVVPATEEILEEISTYNRSRIVVIYIFNKNELTWFFNDFVDFA